MIQLPKALFVILGSTAVLNPVPALSLLSYPLINLLFGFDGIKASLVSTLTWACVVVYVHSQQ